MMRQIFFTLLIGLFSLGANAQQITLVKSIPSKGMDIMSFVPDAYDTLATAAGDLNKDGKEDYAVVLKSKLENLEYDSTLKYDSIPPRILLILFKGAENYYLAAKNDKAIMCKYCGGVFGDPYNGVIIEKGVLIISHYGGSSWRWSYTHKFRFQKNDFYLIGETTCSYWNISHCDKLDEFAATEYYDINYVTGSYEKKKVSEEGCKLLANKKGRLQVKPLMKFSKFSVEN